MGNNSNKNSGNECVKENSNDAAKCMSYSSNSNGKGRSSNSRLNCVDDEKSKFCLSVKGSTSNNAYSSSSSNSSKKKRPSDNSIEKKKNEINVFVWRKDHPSGISYLEMMVMVIIM